MIVPALRENEDYKHVGEVLTDIFDEIKNCGHNNIGISVEITDTRSYFEFRV